MSNNDKIIEEFKKRFGEPLSEHHESLWNMIELFLENKLGEKDKKIREIIEMIEAKIERNDNKILLSGLSYALTIIKNHE